MKGIEVNVDTQKLINKKEIEERNEQATYQYLETKNEMFEYS